MMTRLITICVSAMCIGACATNDASPGAESPTLQDPTAVSPVNEPVAATEPVDTSAQEEISDLDTAAAAPTAETVADQRQDDRICRREVRTGTHRAVRVCRTRAEIEAMKQDGKDTFRDLHRSQSLQDLAEQSSRN